MLDRDLVADVLTAARRKGGDFAELFVEERSSTSVRLDDGRVEELTTGLDRGAGVRVAQGASYGYAYSNRLDREALIEAAAAASAALRGSAAGSIVDVTDRFGPGTNRAERAAGSVAPADKVAWLREVDEVARGTSPEVVQVTGIYFDSLQRRLIAASDGRWIDEERPRIRVVAQVVAKRGDVIQTGWDGPAACAGVEFLDAHPPRVTAQRAASRAVAMLGSIPAPAGEMPVVVANGCGGVLFHEAVGHPLEADAIDKEASVYRGRIGERCAIEPLWADWLQRHSDNGPGVVDAADLAAGNVPAGVYTAALPGSIGISPADLADAQRSFAVAELESALLGGFADR